MYQIAMIWWILSVATEGGGKLVGLFMVMAALPSILFVKKIGGLIDRTSSRKILVLSDMTAAFVIGSAGFLLREGTFVMPLAFLWAFMSALLQAFIDPTLNKAVGEVVEKEDFETGIALLATTQSLANFAGAVLGALLIGWLGIAGTILLSASGYFVSSICSARARFRVSLDKTEESGSAGWELLRDFPFLKKVLVGFGFVNFFATPTLVVLPVYTKRVLMAGADTLGLLEAGLWIGLLMGSCLSRFVVFSKSRITIGVFCLTLFGLCLLFPGIVVNVHLYLLVLILAGAALGVNNVKFMSLFQEQVPVPIKGRFFALMQGVIGFTFPIAYFVFGFLTDLLRVTDVCVIQGVGVILLVGYFIALRKEETEGIALGVNL